MNYQDAMAICRAYDPSDLFVTFTCNRKWRETAVALLDEPGQLPCDRSDLIQGFHMKVDKFKDDIREGRTFGSGRAVLYTVEFQKRGLPHIQCLAWLADARSKFSASIIEQAGDDSDINYYGAPDQIRKSDIIQSPSKISSGSASTTTPAVCRLQGWADLPEGLLQSIIPLLGSFLELLAFSAACRSWRSAFSSYPSKSTFCTLLPPLLVRPHIRVRAPHLRSRSDDGLKLRTCQVLDLANLRTPLRCQIPKDTFEMLHFAGSSYGQLICGGGRNLVVVDVFTGAKVLPPQLPVRFSKDTYFYSGMLTAPLTSHNAHLIVCAAVEQGSARRSLLDWPVGSDSWSELKLNDSRIEQIVDFNGQFIALDYEYRIHTLSLAPHLGLQEIATVWWDDMDECPYLRPWLVVCGDMLLIVDHYISLSFDGAPVNYKAFRLDMSTAPAVWVEVEKLENYVLYIGSDVRSPAFSCVSPGRWGTRNNCLYYAYYDVPWILHGLGDEADAVWDTDNDPDIVFKRNWYTQLQPFWVYPSMFYADADDAE